MLPLFAPGIPQRLAEEISLDLFQQRDAARSRACQLGHATADLRSMAVSYGTLNLTRTAPDPCEVDIEIARR